MAIKKKLIDIEDSQVTKCEVVHTKTEPLISMNISVPIDFDGTEILISRDELLNMISALNAEW